MLAEYSIGFSSISVHKAIHCVTFNDLPPPYAMTLYWCYVLSRLSDEGFFYTTDLIALNDLARPSCYRKVITLIRKGYIENPVKTIVSKKKVRRLTTRGMMVAQSIEKVAMAEQEKILQRLGEKRPK